MHVRVPCRAVARRLRLVSIVVSAAVLLALGLVPSAASAAGPGDGVVASALAGATGTVAVFVETSGEPALRTSSRLEQQGASPSSVDSAVAGQVAATERATAKVEAAAQKADPGATTLYTMSHVASGVVMEVDASALGTIAATAGVVRVSPMIPWTADEPTTTSNGADGADGTPAPGAAATPVAGSALQSAAAAWGEGYTGEGAVIAVLDTGLDYTHADFNGPGTVQAATDALADRDGDMTDHPYDSGKVLPGHDFAGETYDAITVTHPTPDENPVDGEGGGHGTHVAGIAAGYGVVGGAAYLGPYGSSTDLSSFSIDPGTAPKAQILPLKIFGDGGGSTFLGPDALDWIGSHPELHVNVASMSIGSNLTGLDELSRTAVDDLAEHSDVTVVIAAGNSNDVTDVGGAPGLVARALTVAASDDADQVADFSSRGVHGSFQNTVKPDVTAPGVGIVSALRGSGAGSTSLSGTSMATPAVSGVAALVRGAHPGWSALRVKAQIMNTAVHDVTVGSSPGAPARVGTGRIDARAAVDSDVWVESVQNHDTGLVTASFGVLEVDEPTTQTRTVRLHSSASQAITYDASYVARDAMPGVTYTVSPSTVTVPAGGSADVIVTLSIPDPAALVKRRDPTMKAALESVPRQYVADASGIVQLEPTSPTAAQASGATALRLAVYAAPKPVSTMTVDALVQRDASGDGSRDGWLSLAGTGIDQGTGTERFASLVAPLVLGAQSPAQAASGSDVPTAAKDLRAVGASSTAPQHPGSPSVGLLTIGVAAQGTWAQLLAWDPDLTVHLDTDGDGQDDYDVTLSQVHGPYGYVTGDQVYADTSPAGSATVVDSQPVNVLDATTDTNPFDTDVALLPVRLSVLGLTGTSGTVRYRVTTDGDSAPADGGWVSFDAYQPPVWFGSEGDDDRVLFDDQPGGILAHWRSGAALSDLLVLHLHDATGYRWQIVDGASATRPSVDITGTARSTDFRVGDELTVEQDPTAAPCPAPAYSWTRDGTPILGADERTYVPVAADVGTSGSTNIGVQQTCTVAGVTFPEGSALVHVRLGRPTWSSVPTVTGAPVVDRTLTADPGTWTDDDGATTTYAWLRDGAPLVGASARSYTVVPGDAGHRLQVRVTVTRDGLAATSTSVGVTARPRPATVTLQARTPVRRYHAKKRSRVTAVVARPTGTAGTVVFRDGGRTRATVWLSAAATSVTWRAPRKLAVGRHQITAQFVPASADADRATSGAVTLRVKKARATVRLRARVHGRTVRLKVRARSHGAKIAGRYVIKDRHRTVARGRLTHGRRTVRLRHVARGKHRFRVVLKASRTVKKTRSTKVTVRVRHGHR